MSLHSLIDDVAVDVAALVLRKAKLFRESIESVSLADHVEAAEVDLPPIDQVRHYEVAARSLAGILDPAFRIAQWMGDGFPTVIYHHGSGEQPYDRSFRKIFKPAKIPVAANLVAVRIACNRSFDEYKHALRALDNFMAMMAVSARLIESLVQFCRAAGSPCVVVTGISLGGFVANLHRAFFGSAHVYKPLMAGVCMGDVFLDSAYRKLSSPLVHRSADKVRRLLNFDVEFSKAEGGSVHPLLARHDRIVVFESQSRCYFPLPPAVMDRGHTTGALSPGLLRRHVFEGL
jgi:hypothetical protein